MTRLPSSCPSPCQWEQEASSAWEPLTTAFLVPGILAHLCVQEEMPPTPGVLPFFFFNPYPGISFPLLLEREEDIDVRAKHQCETETLIGCLLYIPQVGVEPTTWVCALAGNWIHGHLVHRLMFQPTEPLWPTAPGENSMLPITIFP